MLSIGRMYAQPYAHYWMRGRVPIQRTGRSSLLTLIDTRLLPSAGSISCRTRLGRLQLWMFRRHERY